MHEMIKQNARQIRELHSRLHKACSVKPHGPDHQRACDEFHSQYDALAFPGGYDNGLRRVSEGDSEALDVAVSFLEVRPYFFRSQYIVGIACRTASVLEDIPATMIPTHHGHPPGGAPWGGVNVFRGGCTLHEIW